MPIYMDRHDLPVSINAEEVARLHQEDLKIEAEFGCKGLTYWYDDHRKLAFCLIEAPDQSALQQMHNHAHGAVPNSIIEVNPSVVSSFLGRISDPEKASGADLESKVKGNYYGLKSNNTTSPKHAIRILFWMFFVTTNKKR